MANYPSTQNTDDNLYVGVNNLSTVLTDNPLTIGAGTVNVSSAASFPSVGIITIDLEAIHYTGTTATSFTGCTRGFDGTTAASHLQNATVFHDIPAAHHNVLKDEVKAVSDDLRDTFTGDLDDSVTPASTATDVKERLDHFATQMKNITGETDWKTAPDVDLVTADAELEALKLNTPNVAVNGGMEVWQRNTTFASPAHNAWTADRWRIEKNSSPTVTVSRSTTTSASSPGTYSMRVQITGAGAAGFYRLKQILEYADNYIDTSHTVTAWVKSDVANNARMAFFNGTTFAYSSYHTGDGTWQQLSVTHTAGTELRIYLMVEPDDVQDTYVDSIMVVRGEESIPFVPEDPAIELQRCQRYYQLIGNSAGAPHTMAVMRGSSSNFTFHRTDYPVEMTVSPTITITKGNIYMYHLPTTGNGTGGQESASWTLASSDITVRSAYISFTRTSDQTTYPVIRANYQLALEA